MELYGKVLFLITMSYVLYRAMLFAGMRVYHHYVAQDVSSEYTGSMLMGDIGDALLRSNPLASGHLTAVLVALLIVVAGVLAGESFYVIYGYAVTGFIVIRGASILRKRSRSLASQASPSAEAVSVAVDKSK